MYRIVRVRLQWYQDAKIKIDRHNDLVDVLNTTRRRADMLEKELEKKDKALRLYKVGQIVDREA